MWAETCAYFKFIDVCFINRRLLYSSFGWEIQQVSQWRPQLWSRKGVWLRHPSFLTSLQLQSELDTTSAQWCNGDTPPPTGHSLLVDLRCHPKTSGGVLRKRCWNASSAVEKYDARPWPTYRPVVSLTSLCILFVSSLLQTVGWKFEGMMLPLSRWADGFWKRIETSNLQIVEFPGLYNWCTWL